MTLTQVPLSYAQASLSDFGRPLVEMVQVVRTGRRYAKNESWGWNWGRAFLRFYGDAKPACEIETWAPIGPYFNVLADVDGVEA